MRPLLFIVALALCAGCGLHKKSDPGPNYSATRWSGSYSGACNGTVTSASPSAPASCTITFTASGGFVSGSLTMDWIDQSQNRSATVPFSNIAIGGAKGENFESLISYPPNSSATQMNGAISASEVGFSFSCTIGYGSDPYFTTISFLGYAPRNPGG